jgi:hypothetical protein
LPQKRDRSLGLWVRRLAYGSAWKPLLRWWICWLVVGAYCFAPMTIRTVSLGSELSNIPPLALRPVARKALVSTLYRVSGDPRSGSSRLFATIPTRILVSGSGEPGTPAIISEGTLAKTGLSEGVIGLGLGDRHPASLSEEANFPANWYASVLSLAYRIIAIPFGLSLSASTNFPKSNVDARPNCDRLNSSSLVSASACLVRASATSFCSTSNCFALRSATIPFVMSLPIRAATANSPAAIATTWKSRRSPSALISSETNLIVFCPDLCSVFVFNRLCGHRDSRLLVVQSPQSETTRLWAVIVIPPRK